MMRKVEGEDRINKIIEALMKVARGDYSVQIELSEKSDELDSLAMGFNMMVDDIKNAVIEYKQTKKSLEQSRSNLTALIENTNDLIWSVDKNYKVLTLNSALQQMLVVKYGIKAGEGKNIMEAVPKDHRSGWKNLYDRALSGDRFSIEYPYPVGDSILTFEVSFNPICESNGEITGVSCFGRDITDRTKIEEEFKEKVHKLNKSQKAMLYMVEDLNKTTKELKAAQKELINKERLAVLGQFSGNISHELRNPLGVIDSSIYYLKMKLKDTDKKVQQHLERIKSSVDNATTIIQSLLNLTRIKKPVMSMDNLVIVVSGAITNSDVPDRIKVIENFPEEEVLVNVEREQLRMALKNMIKNAVEAISGKGTLEIGVEPINDEKVALTINDTGCGIAPENLKKIFQPLFTTKARGIGFGLSIAQMIVENHGGSIKVESELKKGSNFIINLPMYIKRGEHEKKGGRKKT